ncbi:hypothetical protein, partial [Thalassobacillus sp. CUG 92003]|uniref:hypothetical protein n=1 Tax=Thalassobacillus sp. CUG 92003 TaxID=2736641 RepID=UPI001C6347CD
NRSFFIQTKKQDSISVASCFNGGGLRHRGDFMTTWIVIGIILAGVVYAIYSVIAKKPLGLYISMVIHFVLGILSLPSIGLYVLGLALLELIIGIVMTIKYPLLKSR